MTPAAADSTAFPVLQPELIQEMVSGEGAMAIQFVHEFLKDR